jgi:hypothetical protein
MMNDRRETTGARWTLSEDCWIFENRGISRARDPKTGKLWSEIERERRKKPDGDRRSAGR